MRREPTPAQPVFTLDEPCPLCKGRTGRRDCPECHGWGKAGVLVEPLHRAVPRACLDVPMAAALARRGSWPEGSGGWLHETTSCIAAVRFWWAQEAFWRTKLGLDGAGRGED